MLAGGKREAARETLLVTARFFSLGRYDREPHLARQPLELKRNRRLTRIDIRRNRRHGSRAHGVVVGGLGSGKLTSALR